MLNNLTTGATYNVRVVAYTRAGAGPYSQPVSFSFEFKVAMPYQAWQSHAILMS